jgi:hypothetical protein
MGNQTAFQQKKKEDLKKGEERLTEYWKSDLEPLSNLTDDVISYLRPGDILTRKLKRGVSGSATSGCYPTNEGGLFVHYCIYVKYLGNNKHRLIEKCNNGKPNCIEELDESSFNLLTYYRLAVNSRYEDTLEVAKFIYRHNLDAGYSSTHANCEHFVTFCLTRNTFASRSRQASLGTAVRDAFALFSVTLGNTTKFITHPFYLMGGDMNLEERIVKTAVPFEFDAEKVAQGQVIMIGFSVREMWHYWIEFDKAPSFYTLHQMEKDDPLKDNRIIKYHR